MSLCAKFFKETVGWETIEDDISFVTYNISSAGEIKGLKIIAMYIEPEFRNKNKSEELMKKMKEIAKENDCSLMSAQVAKNISEFMQQRSEHICRIFGMNKSYEDDNMIIFSRSI